MTKIIVARHFERRQFPVATVFQGKAWKALHFKMRILKKSNSNTKSLAYMSLVRPILEYGAACWDPYREGQKSALDRVQKKAAKFAHHTNNPNWETLESRRKLSKRTLGKARGRL